MSDYPNCVLGWRPCPHAGRNPWWRRGYGSFRVSIRRSTRLPKNWEMNIDGATYWMPFSDSCTSETLAQTKAHAIMRKRLTEALESLEAIA